MTIIAATDEVQKPNSPEKPGIQLANMREIKGLDQQFVADQLNLRRRIIELLEADDYQQLPESVFIKGYLRAYAKFLGVPAEPLVAAFNTIYPAEKKSEKTLWQSKRESNKASPIVRWLTTIIALAALIAVGIWWQTNRDNHPLSVLKAQNEVPSSKNEMEVRLTDLSKMQAMFNANSSAGQITPLESHDGG